MSKFFAASDEEESEKETDDEGSDDGSESESDEEDAEHNKVDVKTADTKPKGMAAFMKDADDDDSDEEDKVRVVRSQRDKKWEQLNDAVTELKGLVKAEDWVKASASFDNINKMFAKAATLVAKEGVPEFYFRLLVDLEIESGASFGSMLPRDGSFLCSPSLVTLASR